ncbi:6-bladed beta-propeller [Cyclobacterium plantarum]|uniref:6-bladed beta-propeller n=1 Tax=Cyclobacterium plantarum TaxID=2716263 RepID=UPI003F6F070B
MKVLPKQDPINKFRNFNGHLTIIFFLVWLFVQCQPKEKNILHTSSILLDENSLFNFEDCVSDIEFIPLLAPKDSLINLSCRVHELVINDKFYYASRCHNDLSIHSFDLAGNHLRSWNRKGDGPEEYPSLHGLMVENNEMYINTGRGTIVKYGLPAFEFKEQINLGAFNFVPTVSFISPKRFLISSEPSGNERNKIFHDIQLEPKTSKTLPVASLPYSGELNPGLLAKMEGSHLLNYGLSDTIYHYHEDSTSIYATLDFGDKSINPVDFELEGGEFIEKVLLSQNYAFNTGHISISGGTLKLLAYGIQKNPDFNRDDLSTFPFYDVFIHPDTGMKKITKALMDVRNKSYSSDGYFYQVMQQEDWQRALDESYFGKHEKKLLKSIQRLSDEEDPIILKYKIAF